MGKFTGFLDYPRIAGTYRPVEERIGHYREFTVAPDEETLRQQGARCMDCGIPYCHAIGCPLYNLIPEWNDAIYKGDWREALVRLEATNNLPEITGRICPAPCETSCTLSINGAPVTIKQIELAIIERGFKKGWVVPRPPRIETGRRVAVVGSGPAGLAAAQQLRRAGHTVTLFEQSEKAGGLLRYGIPDFKLEKWVIDRRIEQMRAEGVRFETNVVIGEDISARYLKKTFDVILLALGAGEPRDLQVPGRGLEGIHFAGDYLTQSNRCIAGEIGDHERRISAKDKTVLVIGGGDTGSDCVGTANRQGARKIYQFEIMPKPLEWKEAFNPNWPFWPTILRTSSSHEEGCERDWNILTKQFTGKDIRVEEGHFARVEWQPQSDGKPSKMVELSGSGFTLKIDLVLLAMGFLHVRHNKLLEDLEVTFDSRSNIAYNDQYATSSPVVFTAGDAGMGASLVVRSIFQGREAAKAIDNYFLRSPDP
ncbi:MAG: glutamate synthase subunit beta [Chitinispirillaceae bacterium]|nr:glutamate synthase subunit beta [Chitinispirillaceae bacterium]